MERELLQLLPPEVQQKVSGEQHNTLLPLQKEKFVYYQTVNDSWNWISPTNPVNGFDSLKGTLNEINNATYGECIANATKWGGRVFSSLTFVNSVIEAMNFSVVTRPDHGINYEVSFRKPGTGLIDIQRGDYDTLTVSVPQKRHGFLSAYLKDHVQGNQACPSSRKV